MLASSRVVHPGWLAAGPVSATEAGDSVKMTMGMQIKANRSSHCQPTGRAIGVIDRQGSPWGIGIVRVGPLVGIVHMAGWCNCMLHEYVLALIVGWVRVQIGSCEDMCVDRPAGIEGLWAWR
jgi:hypothetical protein